MDRAGDWSWLSHGVGPSREHKGDSRDKRHGLMRALSRTMQDTVCGRWHALPRHTCQFQTKYLAALSLRAESGLEEESQPTGDMRGDRHGLACDTTPVRCIRPSLLAVEHEVAHESKASRALSHVNRECWMACLSERGFMPAGSMDVSM